MIDTFHKNVRFNGEILCGKCHQEEHQNEHREEKDWVKKFILYVQNLSIEKKYSKIRILTEYDDLTIDNIGKKFPFYLVEKTL